MKLTNKNAFVKIVPVDSATDSKGKTEDNTNVHMGDRFDQFDKILTDGSVFKT